MRTAEFKQHQQWNRPRQVWDKRCKACGDTNQFSAVHERYYRELLKGGANDPLPPSTDAQHPYHEIGWRKVIQ